MYAFATGSNWPAVARFIAGAVDEKVIELHGDDVLRLTAYVRLGAVGASLMLKRLGRLTLDRTDWRSLCPESVASSALVHA